MATVNLYDILGITPDSSLKELKKAYRTLVLKYHPDKEDGSEELFELITYAYNVLSNEQSRSEYDNLYKRFKESEGDYMQLKQRSSEFNSSLPAKKADDRDQALFDQACEELNRKHGFKSEEQNSAIETENAKKLYDQMRAERERQDREELHERIFDDGAWNGAKFNEAFDRANKTHTELIPHNGNPIAWEGGSSVPYTEFDNIDKLYTEQEELACDTKYGPVNFDIKKAKISKDEVSKLTGANYTANHNKKEQDYDKMIKRKIADREVDTTKYNSRGVSDYDTSDDMGGYGIFSQLGISASNNLLLEFDDKKLKENYKKFVKDRQDVPGPALKRPVPREMPIIKPVVKPLQMQREPVQRFTPEVQLPHNTQEDSRTVDRFQQMMNERKVELIKQKYPDKNIGTPEFNNPAPNVYQNPLINGPPMGLQTRSLQDVQEGRMFGPTPTDMNSESYKDRYQKMMDDRKRIR